MKATMSLKQLRTNPRAFTQLINSGYSVSITEHRKVLATAEPTKNKATSNIAEFLAFIDKFPAIKIKSYNASSYKPALTKALKDKYLV